MNKSKLRYKQRPISFRKLSQKWSVQQSADIVHLHSLDLAQEIQTLYEEVMREPFETKDITKTS